MVARLYQHHLNAEGRHLLREALRVPLDGVLAGGVGALERQPHQPVDGRKQHHFAAAFFPHQRQYLLIHAHHAEEIRLHHAGIIRQRRLFARAEAQHRRAVNDRVWRADLLRAFHKIAHAVVPRHVQRQTCHAPVGFPRERARARDDRPAVIRQCLRRVRAKPA